MAGQSQEESVDFRRFYNKSVNNFRGFDNKSESEYMHYD